MTATIEGVRPQFVAMPDTPEWHAARRDLTGEQFTRLTVLRIAGVDKRRQRLWHCECKCGKAVTALGRLLLSGRVKSCGCHRRDSTILKNTTHGLSHTSEFTIWQGMLRRCYQKSRRDYPRYGGRGILVCDRWRESFENFYVDMGPRPSVLRSLDRYPNNDGNYEPGNVRWAASRDQQRNRRSNLIVAAFGRSQPMVAWAEEFSIPLGTLWARIKKYCWAPEKALTTNIRRKQ